MTPEPPRICAIIALYDGERFIERAIESVRDQSLAPREILVVDDGSRDGGAALARRFEGIDARVRVLSKPNGGQSSARNLGARLTDCDFLAFLDQDDEWYPDHLAKLHAPFQDDPHGRIGFTYANLDEVDIDGRMVNMSFLRQLPTAHPKSSIMDCLRQDMFVLPGASLIRAKVFAEVDGFDERLIGYEDDDLFMRVFEHGYRNVFVDEPVTRWRIHLGSTSYSRKMQRSRMIYAEKLMAKYPDNPGQNRYYTRDLLIPRFAHTIKVEYLGALKAGRFEDALALAGDLKAIAIHMTGKARWKLKALGLLARRRGLTRALYASRAFVPGLRRLALAVS